MMMIGVRFIWLWKVVGSRIRGERFHRVEGFVIVSERLQILEARRADGSPRVEHVEITESPRFVAFGCFSKAVSAL